MINHRAVFNLEERRRQQLKELERQLKGIKADVSPAVSAAQTGPRKLVVEIEGDGEATEFLVRHNFDSRELAVSVAEAEAPFTLLPATITLDELRALTVAFEAAPGEGQQLKVIIIG